MTSESSRGPAKTFRVVDDAPLGEVILWRPRVGEETLELLDRVLPPASAPRVQGEAVEILSRCLPPGAERAERTGLVVGYVQSGKTLSFTTVAALARDNGYQIVIILAGAANVLLTQSRHRLQSDLRLAQANAYERWRRVEIDMSVTSESVVQRMGSCLDEWRDPTVPVSEHATLLITVLKNWQDLRHLRNALARVDLRGTTALVIDDEADQVSLNSRVRQGQESSTYLQLRMLRDTLPRHTLLQYTATPQAPLLLAIADSLSPDFCYLLSAGDEYLHGADLFFEGSPFVKLLEGELADPGDAIAPPPGLTAALATFFVGAAISKSMSPRPANRSMLVHPSRRIEPHETYKTWVNRIKENWRELLSREWADADRAALLVELDRARADLVTTVPGVPAIDQLVPALLNVIRTCQVEVLNAAPGSAGIREIPWSDAFAWVLIGGQLLDRGFTVEGLTVTYMSRPLGGRQADTLWQRARFLGYRKPYMGYVRIFVDDVTDRAFRAYVAHEREMHRELANVVHEGIALRDWRRRFLLDRQLSATRAQVLRTLPRRVTVSNGWLEQRFPHHIKPATTAQNWELLDAVTSHVELRANAGDSRRTDAQKHLVGSLRLRDLVEKLLSRYTLEDDYDATRFSGLDCQLGLYLDRVGAQEELADVLVMRGGTESRRQLNDKDAIDELFQGASVTDPSIYGGDRHIHEDRLTIQIHRLEVHDAAGATQRKGLPTLAVWVPSRMAADILVQADEEEDS